MIELLDDVVVLDELSELLDELLWTELDELSELLDIDDEAGCELASLL